MFTKETLQERRARELSEARFRWLTELIERLRSEKPHWPEEAIEAVYDNVKEKLLKDPNFGQSRSAIWGAIKKQAGWVDSDRKRIRQNPDGSPRHHPRAASSIDRMVIRPDGSELALADLVSGPRKAQPEVLVEDQQEVASIREAARRCGPNVERAVVGVMVGYKPASIAEVCGVKENTVHKLLGRFRALYRIDQEGAAGFAQ